MIIRSIPLHSDGALRVTVFHAKLPQQERETTLNKWLNGEVQIICATIAFGMGIDHPHVRFVVHWNIPKTLENFYQESGRAGRDGRPSQSVLLYSSRDYDLFRFLLVKEESKVDNARSIDSVADQKMPRSSKSDTIAHAVKLLEDVKTFATKKECRRQALMRYFGQKMAVADCGRTCDVCNPRLNFFRFEEKSVVNEGTKKFCRQSIKAIKTQEAFAGVKMRARDARRNNLMYGQSGSYVPEETKAVVVRRGNKRALAADGFIAVNGNVSSGEEEVSDGEEASMVVNAFHPKQNVDDILDVLERAERAHSSEDRHGKRRKTFRAWE